MSEKMHVIFVAGSRVHVFGMKTMKGVRVRWVFLKGSPKTGKRDFVDDVDRNLFEKCLNRF